MEIHRFILQVAVVILVVHTEVGHGHGGLLEPPMRSVAWKYGFDTPVNYDWMSLYCGGLNNFTKNNATCGLCGDPYGGPYENNRGGVYDTGIIVRHYPADLREIEVKVEITAHHKGSFQFKLCPNNAEELTQECLDRYPLLIREGRLQGDPTRYFPTKEPKLNEVHVLLPQGVICDRCVLQWTYTAGNNIGREVQETFVNCADISIGGTIDRVPVARSQPVDGAVLVIEQRLNLTSVIDSAPVDAVNEVLTVLSGHMAAAPEGFVGIRGSNHHNHHHHAHEETGGVRGTEFIHGRQRDSNSRQRDDRDPRTRVPLVNRLNRRLVSMQNGDTPGLSGDDRVGVAMSGQGRPDMNINWNGEGRFIGMSNFGPPRSVGPFRGGEVMPQFWGDPSQMGRLWANNLPPPSEVTMPHLNNERHMNGQGLIPPADKRFPTNSLLGSVTSVAGQIAKDRNTGRSGMGPRVSNIPRHFVNQMNELRRAFPNSRQWRRGDGMTSPRHAVRQSSRADTHDFSVDEIRQLVPSLPANIGPRQDIDRRFISEQTDMRENWFPESQILMQRQRMRQMSNRRRPRLPRRIEVHTMVVAQHLLRKYPQLRGRVFLSRRGHVRNQYSHMVNKYARRRNWSTIR